MTGGRGRRRAARGINRREALRLAGTGAAALLLPREAFAARLMTARVAHLLPAADHRRILLKVSFVEPLVRAPRLVVGRRRVTGARTDSDGRFYSFLADDLAAATAHDLRLESAGGEPLTDRWTLRTLPDPGAAPERVRVLVFTCAGGNGEMEGPGGRRPFLPVEVRQRLLERALSFAPDLAIANGDHVYWDQRAWLESENAELRERVGAFAARFGRFDHTQAILGTENEGVLKRVVDEQIARLYGTRLRSVPTFFLADDHDAFENDEANERFVTFPPEEWNQRAESATRRLYYPEFLPAATRPRLLPGATAGAGDGWSDSFGTLRYGKLLEAVLYDCGRHLSLKGKFAGLVPPEAEAWLLSRTGSADTAHLLHVPSHPFGWSAGKWREWYPDVLIAGSHAAVTGEAQVARMLGERGRLGIERPKFFWQEGWFLQHQRLLEALAAQPSRPGVIVSGDLHAVGWGRILGSGALDLGARPVTTILAGPLGTAELGFPSAARGTPPAAPAALRLDQRLQPVEKNGFTLLDVTPEAIAVRQFAWRPPEPLEAIDRLEPVAEYELRRG